LNDRSQLFQELRTIRDFIRWGTSRFVEAGLWFGHGTDNAWDEAAVLVMHAIHLAPPVDAGIMDAALTGDEKHCIVQLLERRIQERMPAPYLTGKAWFAGLEFYVDQRVLIPRSPLAELIEQGMQPWISQAPTRILDLCTGSGCIGIACAYAFPDSLVDLSDISPDALEVARRNLFDHGLEDRVTTVISDLFQGLQGKKYDLIVANPPYVDAKDLAAIPAEYRHEPALALASGEDGLDFTRRLLREAVDYMADDAVLIVEVGNSWVNLEQAFPELPFTWVDFERGGDGVFVLSRDQLVAATHVLDEAD